MEYVLLDNRNNTNQVYPGHNRARKFDMDHLKKEKYTIYSGFITHVTNYTTITDLVIASIDL